MRGRESWFFVFLLASPFLAAGTEQPIILDNGGPGTAGIPPDKWKLSLQPNPYGADSLYATRADTKYTFQFGLLAPGAYQVSLWWTAGSSRRSSIPVDIAHAGGVATVNINQQVNGGRWNVVGTWSFGTAATITVRSLGLDADGKTQTCADAVRLVSAGAGNQAPVAIIDSVTPQESAHAFSGHGTDPDGTIAAYRWRSSIDGELSNQASFSVTLSPGSHTVYFSVQDNAGAWSAEVTTTVNVAPPPPAGVEVILDNGAPGTSSAGATWKVSGALSYYGADSLYTSKAGATYTFNLNLPQAGLYEVYLWWTRASTRRADVPVDIVHGAGTATVTVDQLDRNNAGRWNRLGAWNFAGRAAATIRSLGGDLTTCADAIRLVLVSGVEEEPSGLDVRPSNPDCILLERPGGTSGLRLERAFPNLSIDAVALLQAPGDASRWFLIERVGRVLAFANQQTVSTASTFLDIRSRVQVLTETGMMGMAFHPSFRTNGQVFIFYTRANYSPRSNFISRFTSSDGGATLDPNSEVVLIRSEQPSHIHAGGHLAFGPDGYLYIGLGEVAREEKAQDTTVLPGSFLRIDVNRGSPYAIPPDNPFASGAGGNRPEIYCWGLRSPWGWSFDRVTGELWVGDVGATKWEEVDRIVKGANYGWPIRQGAHCNGTTTCDTTGLTDPVVEYSHSEGNAIIGGYVYRGTAIPHLYGIYIYGDYGSGKFWALYHDQLGNPAPQLLAETGVTIISFAEDLNGELYIVAGGSKLYRLLPGTSGAPDSFPQRLSDVPCVEPADPGQAGSGLIPYDINVPFWSDNAVKQRWLALPDGSTIHIGSDGDWSFPIGTVFMKSFRLGGKLIETRLLVRHGDGEWAGYSYEWDDAQTDAFLLPGEKTKAIGGQNWTYPSRAQCLSCHTAAATRVLGVETAQMNRSFTYPSTGRTANQLATFQHIGLFDGPLGAPSSALPALPAVTDPNEPLELRARSYLHSNCSHCHRPGGPGGGMDLRFDTPAADMGACNVVPSAGNLGVSGARLILPGDPSRSLISLRLHLLDQNRMPPIGKNVLDSAGVQVMDDWIASLTGCP